MSEQQAERLARLEALARKALGPFTTIQAGDWEGDICEFEVFDADDMIVMRTPIHARSLDALEAALHALNDEPANLTPFDQGCFESMRGNLDTMRRHLKRKEHELAELRAKLATKVAEWRAQAEARGATNHEVGAFCAGHADELEAVLKGGE